MISFLLAKRNFLWRALFLEESLGLSVEIGLFAALDTNYILTS